MLINNFDLMICFAEVCDPETSRADAAQRVVRHGFRHVRAHRASG
jgi:hypothetical protein